MKFALVNGERREATKGLQGVCPSCGRPLQARCGELRVHHWAHQRTNTCDSWWENETEWHRSWKNQFPSDWQEIIMNDQQTGEIHIADVRRADGLVIEFQHSNIKSEERISRERFYKNMIWVVDGTRLKRDYPRFQKGIVQKRTTNRPGFYHLPFPEKCFPIDWVKCSVPVFFDFKGTEFLNTAHDDRNNLHVLLPRNHEGHSFYVQFQRELFIQRLIEGSLFAKPDEPEAPVNPPQTNFVIPRPRGPEKYLDGRGQIRRRSRL
jgi:competence protein CoiA